LDTSHLLSRIAAPAVQELLRQVLTATLSTAASDTARTTQLIHDYEQRVREIVQEELPDLRQAAFDSLKTFLEGRLGTDVRLRYEHLLKAGVEQLMLAQKP
jgi:hypothetical protein